MSLSLLYGGLIVETALAFYHDVGVTHRGSDIIVSAWIGSRYSEQSLWLKINTSNFSRSQLGPYDTFQPRPSVEGERLSIRAAPR